MKRYHAHIYFETRDLEIAQALVNEARSIDYFQVVTIHGRPAGPHPLANLELHFGESALLEAKDWIESRRGFFPTLIHEDTGDDHRDHTDGIRWLGKELPLDFKFFDLVKLRPELAIHPITKSSP